MGEQRAIRSEGGAETTASDRRRQRRRGRRRPPGEPLAVWMRALLFLVGWLLVLLGLVGLVLPVLQGILFLVAGAAVLSLASELAYEVLRFVLRRWPRTWLRVARWRRRVHRRLEKIGGRRRPAGES